MFDYTAAQLHEIAQLALAMARRAGASDAAVDLSESNGLSVNVRNAKPETIEQTRDKSFGITVYFGQRRGNAASNDFSLASVQSIVDAACAIARNTQADDCAGLPEPGEFAKRTSTQSLGLYFPWDPSAKLACEMAAQAEAAAKAVSPLIRDADGASVSAYQGHFVSANSRGFVGGYPYSRHSLACGAIAKRGQSMQRDGWYSSARAATELADPQAVGRYAAQRALARLGARQLPTGKMPVLFEAPIASGLLGSFVQAVSGGALYRNSSFLLDSLGKSVFPAHIDIFEDPSIVGGFGSGPFDDEGVATHKRKVVQKGVVQGYFLSTYTARKLKMKTTGNAGGAHNLRMTSRLTAPTDSLKAMIKKMHRGLLVTDLMGQGVNYVTGDYSRGASGFWVDGGKIQYPVEEITIAGNMRDMLQAIVGIGSDQLTRGTKTIGSVLIEQMSVAGT
jgi:PmbA protein